MTKNLRKVVAALERVRADRTSGERGVSHATVFLDTPDVEILIEAGQRVLAMDAATGQAFPVADHLSKLSHNLNAKLDEAEKLSSGQTAPSCVPIEVEDLRALLDAASRLLILERQQAPQFSGISVMVREFMASADQPVLPTPQVPSDERVRLRARLILEESLETLSAMFCGAPIFEELRIDAQRYMDMLPVGVNLTLLADGCADMDYVVEGTRLECGINGKPIAEVVHASNMAKFGPGSYRRADGKQMKPEGWTPPDIEAELRKQTNGETDTTRSDTLPG